MDLGFCEKRHRLLAVGGGVAGNPGLRQEFLGDLLVEFIVLHKQQLLMGEIFPGSFRPRHSGDGLPQPGQA